MTRPPSRRTLRFPTRNYPLRVFGMLLGCLPVVTMLAEQDATAWTWASLGAMVLVWPHLAMWLARRSREPIATEMRSLTVDTGIAVFWLTATGFSPLPAVALLSMQAVDKLSVGGPRFLLRTWAWSLPWAAAAVLWTQPSFAPTVSTATTLACLPNLIFYPLAVGWLNFKLTRRLVEQHTALRRLNRDDAQTDVANQRYWGEMVALELNRHRRTRRPAALLLIELDDVRDLAQGEDGFAVSDRLLRAVARTLRRFAREIDIPGRVGEATFGLLLPETDVPQALALAERLRHEIQQIGVDGLAGPVRVCIGLAPHPAEPLEAADWIARADVALYRAKTTGGDAIDTWAANDDHRARAVMRDEAHGPGPAAVAAPRRGRADARRPAKV